jgi:hypothetical protein
MIFTEESFDLINFGEIEVGLPFESNKEYYIKISPIYSTEEPEEVSDGTMTTEQEGGEVVEPDDETIVADEDATILANAINLSDGSSAIFSNEDEVYRLNYDLSFSRATSSDDNEEELTEE